MRAIWKGVISFGLVSIPVKVFPATEERDISFRQVRRSDGARIRYRRVAATDGADVPTGDIAKGYELSSGEIVVLEDEDFAHLPLRTSREVEVLSFVPLEQVDPIYFARSYYLEPDTVGIKPYVLLREALGKSGRVALVKIALRSKETLGLLRIRDDVLVLSTMIWPDEVRRPDFAFLDAEVAIRPQEVAMATSLVDTLVEDFNPELYHDEYRAALQEVLDAKVAGREVISPPEVGTTGGGGEVVDLLAALRASVAAAKRVRESEGTAKPAESAPGSPQTGESVTEEAGTREAGTREAGTREAGTREAAVKRSRAKKSGPGTQADLPESIAATAEGTKPTAVKRARGGKRATTVPGTAESAPAGQDVPKAASQARRKKSA